jgi:6-pyruvoyltetrahydropterin/6-carboxytetrahydropterin synthase
MPEHYAVRLDKEYHVFSAAHFITFNGNICERLHGHNYRVTVEVPGPLDENHYVIDFIALRDELKAIIDELDHRVLLPTNHPLIQVQISDREVEARFEDRRWLFPLGDCALLPVANTTADLVARYIGRRLLDAIARRTGIRPPVLEVGVDENNGQWAICRLEGE